MSLSAFCTKFKLNKSFYRIISSNSINVRQYTSEPAKQHDNNEVVTKAVYPPIEAITPKRKRELKRIAWHEDVKKLKTIEEKSIKINMPKYYGYQMMMLYDDNFPYDCLPFIQHWTRTLYEDGVPKDWCKRSAEEIDGHVKNLMGPIEESISILHHDLRSEYDGKGELHPVEQNRLKSLMISTEINRLLLNASYSNYSHLREVEVDLEPRHEASWFVGGIAPPVLITKKRKNCKYLLDAQLTVDEPVDRSFQYVGKPLLAVRHRQPLTPIHENFEDKILFNGEEVPSLKSDPRRIGYHHAYQYARNIPGFWPGSEHKFGLLSYHDRRHLVSRDPNYGEEDNQCALNAQGILSSFGWLMGQACYQGFSTYNDLTYPLTAQTIITDGQNWSFYAYQMNTTAFNTDFYEKNHRANKCWGSPTLKLFEEVDANGKVIGLNDEVIRHLVQFYLNEPKARDYEMQPYLGAEEKVVADIDDVDRRNFLEKHYKKLCSNVPRPDLTPEIYLWEKIYKIDNQKMPMEARRKFFELNENPFKRRLDQHAPIYVPKKLRPGGLKDKNRYAKTYWP